MTIDTQKLRETAQRVISESGESWYCADQMGGVWLASEIPETDAMHIEAASPAAIVDLCDILDAANEQVAEYARIFDRIRAEADAKIDALAAESERLRQACREAINLLGMDRPIDPTDVLRAALSETNDDR